MNTNTATTDKLTVLTGMVERIANAVEAKGDEFSIRPLMHVEGARYWHGKAKDDHHRYYVASCCLLNQSWENLTRFIVEGIVSDGPANFTYEMETVWFAMRNELNEAKLADRFVKNRHMKRLYAAFLCIKEMQDTFNKESLYKGVSLERETLKSVHAEAKCQGCWSHKHNIDANVRVEMTDGRERDYCYSCAEALHNVDLGLFTGWYVINDEDNFVCPSGMNEAYCDEYCDHGFSETTEVRIVAGLIDADWYDAQVNVNVTIS